MSVRTDAAANHAKTAEVFTQRVEETDPSRWESPSPVEGWAARDVVRHLITWLPGFLENGAGVRLPDVPSVDDDPAAAWKAHVAHVQDLLEDPKSDDLVYHSPMMGDMPIARAIDQFYTTDIFMHTWDLARATGQDDTLDEQRCQEIYEGMLPMDEALRVGDQFGPRIDVPEDASFQDKMIGFIGRQP